MYYVKNEKGEILFKSSFFKTPYSFAQNECELIRVTLRIWKDNTIIKYFRAD